MLDDELLLEDERLELLDELRPREDPPDDDPLDDPPRLEDERPDDGPRPDPRPELREPSLPDDCAGMFFGGATRSACGPVSASRVGDPGTTEVVVGRIPA